MTKKTRILISVLSALLASFCFFAYVQSVRAEAEKSRAEAIQKYGGELTSILVATKQIEPGETLSSSNTQVKSWISDLIPEGAITNPESVMGRTVSSVIGVGMPVVSLHLRSVASQITIPENLIGLTISHGEKYGLAERLSAGTKLAAYEVTDSLITCIASDISVLSDDTEGTLYTSSSVTLGLTPEQVPAVLSAYARGTLRFTLPGSKINAQDLLHNNSYVEEENPKDLSDTTNQSNSSSASEDVQPENPASPTADQDSNSAPQADSSTNPGSEA
ncbi:Flp pilus assembly protein CpaB [Lancefieldella parvula]|uniref:Flp pilus assembly protein CpaB n=1 Tax=Lancefieldella parvula TaxID=1382 RepID=UPI00288901F4|nr:SAF domain-containing protein [Lancefieldella parvula]